MVRKGSPVRVRQRALRDFQGFLLSVRQFVDTQGNMRGTSVLGVLAHFT
jgi:hypothetical protein